MKRVNEDYSKQEVKVYRLGVEDAKRQIHWMEAVGVECLTKSVPLHDEETLMKYFPEILEEAMKRPAGAAGLLISMTERQLYSHGGIEKGKLRLSQMPLGCGQVLTGVAPWGDKGKGEEVSAEFRALQGATTTRPTWGRSLHMAARASTQEVANEREEREGKKTDRAGISSQSKDIPQQEGRPTAFPTSREEKSSTANLEEARRVPKQVVLWGKGLLTDSGPRASKVNQGKEEKETGGRQEARKTRGWKDHKKKVKQGSRAQDPANELIPQKKGQTHELSPRTVAERPTGKATHTGPQPRTTTPGQARNRPRTSSRLLGLKIFRYIIKPTRAKPEEDATLFTACCLLLISPVEVEC